MTPGSNLSTDGPDWSESDTGPVGPYRLNVCVVLCCHGFNGFKLSESLHRLDLFTYCGPDDINLKDDLLWFHITEKHESVKINTVKNYSEF